MKTTTNSTTKTETTSNKETQTMQTKNTRETERLVLSAIEAGIEAGIEAEAEETKAPRTIARQMARYAPGYEPGINARGQKTLTTGDDLAHLLLALTPEQTMALAEKLIGMEKGTLANRYERLNPGQKRMNSGNQIRSRVKKGTLTIEEIKKAIPGLGH